MKSKEEKKIERFVHRFKRICTHIDESIDRIYSILLEYGDKKSFESKKREFQFFTAQKLSKVLNDSRYLFNDLTLNRHRTRLYHSNLIAKIDSEQKRNDFFNIVGLEHFKKYYIEAYMRWTEQYLYFIVGIIESIKGRVSNSGIKKLSVFKSDIGKCMNLIKEIKKARNILNKLEIDINYYYEHKEKVSLQIPFKRISKTIDLGTFSNLRGQITLNIILTNIAMDTLKHFQDILHEKGIYDYSSFFSYCEDILYKSVRYMIQQSENLFKEVYSSYFNLNCIVSGHKSC